MERVPGTTLPSKRVTSPAATSCQGPSFSLLLAELGARMSPVSAPAMHQAGTSAGLDGIDLVEVRSPLSLWNFRILCRVKLKVSKFEDLGELC